MSQYNEVAVNPFFDCLTEANSINKDWKDICDKPIASDEVLFAIHHLKLNKSPGTDTLTSEFYNTFHEQHAPFLHCMYTESIESQTLPPTLSHGLLTLITKTSLKFLL